VWPLGYAVLVACCGPQPTPPPSSRIALTPIELSGIGDLEQGATSGETLVIRVTENETDSILAGAGAFDLVLADRSGGSDQVVFTGTPQVTAPGSLGVTATLARGNVLAIEIVDSDTFNVEQVTIEGLALSAAASAPEGQLSLTVTNCSGSLAGCVADEMIGSPGTIVARP
jgi:hypothetical protein